VGQFKGDSLPDTLKPSVRLPDYGTSRTSAAALSDLDGLRERVRQFREECGQPFGRFRVELGIGPVLVMPGLQRLTVANVCEHVVQELPLFQMVVRGMRALMDRSALSDSSSSTRRAR
jgi:hypothetical protein